MSITPCCKDCQDRYPACHDHCSNYKNEKAVYLQKKADIKKEKDKYKLSISIIQQKERKLYGKTYTEVM